jgi:hypothetical protein
MFLIKIADDDGECKHPKIEFSSTRFEESRRVSKHNCSPNTFLKFCVQISRNLFVERVQRN